MMELIQYLNTDKIFYACTMLSMNFGSRFVMQDITKLQEKALASTIAKRFILFCMVFVATRDLITSLCITFAIVVVTQYLLNENSHFCIIPNVIEKSLLNEYIKFFTKKKRM
jgi:hypothetical protein